MRPFPASCFLISHAHLDHVVGLVLSAGSLTGCRKHVWAPPSVLKILETIFSDRIWPNLASWGEDDAPFKLLYRPYVLHLYPRIIIAPPSRPSKG